MANIFREGKVHVCKEMCSTCIFHPGNLMYLEEGRADDMIREAMESDCSIVCHQTLDGDNAVCRGFFTRYAPPTLQLAQRLGIVKEVACGNASEIETAGKQHETFCDTLP